MLRLYNAEERVLVALLCVLAAGAGPGFLERGFVCIKGIGGSLC